MRVALDISGKLVSGASHFNGRSGQVIVPMLDGMAVFYSLTSGYNYYCIREEDGEKTLR